MKRDLYCELDFWNHLCYLYESELEDDVFSDEPDKNGMVNDFIKLIDCSNSYFDCSVKDFHDSSCQDHELSRRIWKRSTDGRCNLYFSVGKINAMKVGSSVMSASMYNSLFFTLQNYEQHANDVGVINVCRDNLFNNEYYFEAAFFPFKKNGKANLSWCNAAKHSHNSMIIIDNYIFGDNENDNKLNLKETLNLLLPQKLSTRFYLSVFTLGPYIDRKKEKLEEYLKSIRKNLDVEVEVFEGNKDDFHDRWILTNYIYVSSGYGFSNLKEDKYGINVNAKKTTGVSFVYPYLTTKKIKENYKIHFENIIDDCKNRLKKIGKSSNNRLLR